MWAEPQLEPVYGAVRSYLEIEQRVGLLTERLEVVGDLLAILKDQVGAKHGEYLEWIGGSFHFLPSILLTVFSRSEYVLADKIAVIVLIAAEILVAAINIVVDLYAGVD